MPDRIDPKSLDVAAQRRAELKSLFPAAFTETRNERGELHESIDFEKLKAELGTFSDVFENHRERYGMDWPGKKDCLKVIRQPSLGTLKPCREESVDFDSTENLFIEGDNLEVLKLLLKSYYGKVKMIYIDPPYNTGKEFIYPDNYGESLDTYLAYAGLSDSEGKKFATNTLNEGRFHTKWLNMMYPRLYLARNLLREDGSIFISIDDNELSNLRLLCDDVFGAENFLALLPWKGRGGGADNKTLLENHEYVICYAKACEQFATGRKLKIGEKFSQYDEIKHRNYKTQLARKWGSNSRRQDRPNLFYPVTAPNGDSVLPRLPDGTDGCWRWCRERMELAVAQRDVEFRQRDDKSWDVYEKIYEPVAGERRTTLYSAWLQDEIYEELEELLIENEPRNTAYGTSEIRQLFDGAVFFDYPKPTPLLKILMGIGAVSSSDVVLDFFAGSATTAHAVLDLNAKDDGNRKFICVQLPEPCDPESDAFKAGFHTIVDIAKERIRRVSMKLIDEDKSKPGAERGVKQDRGFRVLKLDRSNFRQWPELAPDTPPEQIAKQLDLHVDHVNADASPEDLLFEVLIKAGIAPSAKIQSVTLAGLPVYSIDAGSLLICLSEKVSTELIEEVAKAAPAQFICLDRAFHGNDQLKANAVQTFEAQQRDNEKGQPINFRTI